MKTKTMTDKQLRTVRLRAVKRLINESVARIVVQYVSEGEADFVLQHCEAMGILAEDGDAPREIKAYGRTLAARIRRGR